MKITIDGIKRELARRHLLDFIKYTMPEYQVENFHKNYVELLTMFAFGEIKKLIISMPPQHGKSQVSTRHLPSYLLGLDPDLKIAIASYSTTFAQKFNRDCQRIIDTPEYYSIFPDTTLNQSNVVTVASNYLRNASEFEVVNKKGSLKAVGRGGALTGNAVDVMIMDDLYKDYAEGNSPVIRESVWDWYTSVVKTRLHNDSQQLIVFTRWHDEDLIGRLEKIEPIVEVTSFDDIKNISRNTWVKINFEAIKETEPTELDPRELGQALWETKHSKEKLLEDKALDPIKFECLQQGNPSNSEEYLYNFKTYSPNDLSEFEKIISYTDTADTGKDYLFSVIAGKYKAWLYVLDIVCSPEPVEITEPLVAAALVRNRVGKARIESNAGGRTFARNVEKIVREKFNSKKCKFDWFHQSKNKESRILTNSSIVNNTVLMPYNWEIKHPEAYNILTKYRRNYKANRTHDPADGITGLVEMVESIKVDYKKVKTLVNRTDYENEMY